MKVKWGTANIHYTMFSIGSPPVLFAKKIYIEEEIRF